MVEQKSEKAAIICVKKFDVVVSVCVLVMLLKLKQQAKDRHISSYTLARVIFVVNIVVKCSTNQVFSFRLLDC